MEGYLKKGVDWVKIRTPNPLQNLLFTLPINSTMIPFTMCKRVCVCVCVYVKLSWKLGKVKMMMMMIECFNLKLLCGGNELGEQDKQG